MILIRNQNRWVALLSPDCHLRSRGGDIVENGDDGRQEGGGERIRSQGSHAPYAGISAWAKCLFRAGEDMTGRW